jgi:hypothetical protein
MYREPSAYEEFGMAPIWKAWSTTSIEMVDAAVTDKDRTNSSKLGPLSRRYWQELTYKRLEQVRKLLRLTTWLQE